MQLASIKHREEGPLTATKLSVDAENFSRFISAWLLQRTSQVDFRQEGETEGIVMNTFAAKGNWNIARGKLKQKFARLLVSDQKFFEGKEQELIGRILKRAGKKKKHLEHEYCSHCKF